MLETKTGVFFIAGLGFFALAFLSNAAGADPDVSPSARADGRAAASRTTATCGIQFEDLARRFPDSFTAAYGRPPEDAAEREKWLDANCREALRLGRKVYVGEGCWHCHSQFVRPVSNEDRRWGPVSQDRGIPERAPASRDVRHPARRARPEPRGRPALQRLARRPLLPADDALRGLADARIPLVLRRLARQAQRSAGWP